MTKDEALKLALEALKAKDTWGSSIRDAKEKAIKALEEALAQPAQGPDLSGLKPATQEAIKGWIADRTVVERAVGVMFEQEREISRLEKLAAAQPASPECKTVAEQTAYAFGWWKALESVKTGQPAQEPWKSSDTAHRPGGLPQDFTAHEVELFGDWSEWVSPDSEQYFMKCCDCGLVHEMQFKVAKYSEGDECEFVADADLQAVFRARRATPPAAQPAQEPVAQWQKRHHLWTEGAWENSEEHDAKQWRDKAQGWEIRALYITPQQQEPRNFCSRCGKRTADLTVIHTCTPPRGLEMT